MLEKIKTILTFFVLLAVAVVAVLAIMLVMDVGSGSELVQTLMKALSVIGILAGASIVVLVVLKLKE